MWNWEMESAAINKIVVVVRSTPEGDTPPVAPSWGNMFTVVAGMRVCYLRYIQLLFCPHLLLGYHTVLVGTETE